MEHHMEHHTGPLLDPGIIAMVLKSMPLGDRFICALVCKAWAEAATAATHSIIKDKVKDLSGLQTWMEQHGNRIEVLQLHFYEEEDEEDYPEFFALPACCAKLKDLLLHGKNYYRVRVASRTWGLMASATKLTSISLSCVQTNAQQADVVSALTALPNLEQLTWCSVYCSNEQRLSNSSLLQQMTQLTSLELQSVTAAALQHLGSLTKLQHLSISAARSWTADDWAADHWAAAGCPWLQELKALTSLKLATCDLDYLLAGASQLTALRQLHVCRATPTALNQLQVLTGLTQLCVKDTMDLSPPLQLPGLQELELTDDYGGSSMPMSFLASCTQLKSLKLQDYQFTGPGSLVVSTMLQHLELSRCSIPAADGPAADGPAAGGPAEPVSWQQVLLGPHRLPQLTSLLVSEKEPKLQQADVEAVVACYSNLKALGLNKLQSSLTPTLARLPGLTSLALDYANEEECSALVQLTGLRQLMVSVPQEVSAVGLRQLAAMTQLTSLGFSYFGSQLDNLAKHLMKDNLPSCSRAFINKAPSGSPPDVSSRLLDICDVVDACEGLSMEAVIADAERKLEYYYWYDDPPKSLTAPDFLAAARALKA